LRMDVNGKRSYTLDIPRYYLSTVQVDCKCQQRKNKPFKYLVKPRLIRASLNDFDVL